MGFFRWGNKGYFQKCLIKYEVLKNEKTSLDCKMKDYNKILKEIIKITRYGNVVILNIVYNKKIDEHVLVYKELDDFQIYVKAPGIRSSSTGLPTNIKLLVERQVDDNSIFIEDIQTGAETSMGFGEIALTHLIEEAKKGKISKITGLMVYDDLKHRERQVSFYQDLGFRINGDNISLHLV